MTEALNFLKKMLEIHSPSGQERTLANFLEEKMKEFGFHNVRLDEVGNVYGEKGGGTPKIFLCGHMDTVPGRLPVKIENDKLFGRGAVDAKSALAAMVLAAAKIRSQEAGEVIVVGAVDEEGKGRGIRQIVRNQMDVDYAIFGEPSGVNSITIGYKGKISVKITCQTEPGHTSAPAIFENAIEKAQELWTTIKKTLATEQERRPRSMYYSTTVCVTGIRGGGVSGVIPNRCEFDLEVRVPPSKSCQKSINWLEAVIQRFKGINPNVLVQIQHEDMVEPYIAKKDSPVIRALRRAITNVVGGPVKLLRKTGTGDMNVFAIKKVPVVTYGPGNAHLSHTLNEYVEIKEYTASIEVIQKAIEYLLSSEKPS